MHHILVVIQEGGDVNLSKLVDEARDVRNVLVFVAEVHILVIDAAVARITCNTTSSSLVRRPPEAIQATFRVDVIVERVLPRRGKVAE